MPKQTKATLKNSKPKAGQSLHKFIAQGGSPANFNRVNKRK